MYYYTYHNQRLSITIFDCVMYYYTYYKDNNKFIPQSKLEHYYFNCGMYYYIVAGPDCCANVLAQLASSGIRKREQQSGCLENEFNMGTKVS